MAGQQFTLLARPWFPFLSKIAPNLSLEADAFGAAQLYVMPQEGAHMFDAGREYTRDEIHAQVGGSKQSYLPSKNGAVVAACLTHKLNPRAPQVILCGCGARIAPAGQLLAAQPYAIPVFLKRGVNRWEYQGLFRPVTSHTSGPEFDGYVAGSGRPIAEVSRVVVLKAVSNPS